MALISLEQAAQQLEISAELIKSWAEKGLLAIHEQPAAAAKYVDEEELHQVAESLGWLQLSADRWDAAEED